VKLSSIRVLLSRITTKKVPALTLVIVGIMGMIAGVLAENITITQNSTSGQIGTYNNNTGNLVINDQGLSIVANVAGISPNSTATIGGTGTNKNLFSGSTFTAGHWMETMVFSDSVDSNSHTVTIKINDGAGVPNSNTPLAGGTVTLTLTAASSTGTITAYIDLGLTSITAPMTVYVTST